VLVAGLVALTVILFGLRSLLAILSIAEWTTFWRVVAIPTDLLVRPLELLPELDRTLIGQLSAAELLATGAIGFGALFVLSSLALRR
jgi:hypothetical protein